jgi:hypothetical protein
MFTLPRLRLLGVYAAANVCAAQMRAVTSEGKAVGSNAYVSAKNISEDAAENACKSVFVVLVRVSRSSSSSNASPTLVSTGTTRRFPFRLGSSKLCASRPDITHHSNIVSVPRALLVLSWRGGLEVPGGSREPHESPAAAAERELLEEAGVQLEQPLTWRDAAAVLLDAEGRPTRVVYMRELSDEVFTRALQVG